MLVSALSKSGILPYFMYDLIDLCKLLPLVKVYVQTNI